MKYALFSLHDPREALPFARELFRLGWKILATSNVHRYLVKHKILSEDIAHFLGVSKRYPFPPTLHPEMELALTAVSGRTIDLVYNTTYPSDQGLDVGGHTLLALAAKGKRIVVSSKYNMARVMAELKKNKTSISKKLRSRLIEEALDQIQEFYLRMASGPHEKPVRGIPLSHGENPYQHPAHLFHINSLDPLALGQFVQVAGELPCFTNMADFNSVLVVLCALAEVFRKKYGRIPKIVVAAKHGNPCGLAVDWKSPAAALRKALWGNPRAIWGGELITNFEINDQHAEILYRSRIRKERFGSEYWMLDLIAAPALSKKAVRILSGNLQRKIFVNKRLNRPERSAEEWGDRPVRGGFLRQPPHHYLLHAPEKWCRRNHWFEKQFDSLAIAWATAWFSFHGGNEVAIAKDGALLGAAGGPSTVESCQSAVLRSRGSEHNLRRAVFAANAFFPFIDGPKILAEAGCSYGVCPAGGKHFKEVRKFFKAHHIEMLDLPPQFRGFSRH
jgi:AICAR transformylase/IMP cyclohydrolase PurH